jgi:uncharacterized membrane protein YhaH (DUF805 family)
VPPAQAPMERLQPPRAAPVDDLEEDFDLGVEPENGDEDEVYYEEEPAPAAKETTSHMYSTRRALAEQVNQEVGERPSGEETTGLDALRDRREAWKKMVRAKEQEGRSPYVARWAKVSFFPFLYMIISLQLLRSITYEYAEHYDYNSLYLVAGLLVGLVIVVSFAVTTMLRARRSKRPVLLKGKSSWFGVIVFLAGSLYLGWVYGLAYAWQFSIGFLGAGLLVVVFGFLIEKSAKGTFWIKDPTDKSDKRWLEFIPQSAEG